MNFKNFETKNTQSRIEKIQDSKKILIEEIENSKSENRKNEIGFF